MEHTELSLGPPRSIFSAESDAISTMKRKQQLICCNPVSQRSSIDLQLNDPLPLDWEQCLDLESGNMYYLNRKKMKTSWMRPKEASMELDLNISALPFSEGKETYPDQEMKQGCSSGGNMVALVCVNCHLLVMMFKSSPLCPNCKYLHLLQSQDVSRRNLEAVKPLETLSLLR
ncbi:uncharacterized protein LOC122019936 [Zingiber officinale]|uniref:uncharacterized protein LOC122019936 n=1 Tax=Zingiber officinale TaxID=94328 RepID=UPI001C4CABE4|nr:uncharacterized protein LOC122019936 [Zingiber officinale]